MSVTLRADQSARIEKLVNQGAYADPAAVVDEALSLLESRTTFRTLVQEGIDAVERGEIIDHETVMRDVRQRIADVAAGRHPSAMP